MTSNKDVRWEQRFSNFNKALKKLTEAVDYIGVATFVETENLRHI